jgi:uncharacterized protein YpbB
MTEVAAVDFWLLILLAKRTHQTFTSYQEACLAEELHNFHLLNRVG